jgi:hypothetical protein
MLFKFFFKQWSLPKQVSYLRRKGILIGTRTKDSRMVYIYMYHELFAEIIFKNDDPNGEVEKANVVQGLKNLNTHLENEFKTNF